MQSIETEVTRRHPPVRLSIAIHNQVLLVLILGAALAVALTGFVAEAPNRLVSGEPIPLWRAARLPTAGVAVLGAALLAGSVIQPSRRVHYAAAVCSGLLLLLVLAAAGRSASVLMLSAKPATRVSLGPAFWILVVCAALSLGDAVQRLRAGIALRVIAVVTVAAGVAVLAAAGTFDALSIAREYATRQQMFADALARHMTLVGASVGAALLIGFPLGVAAVRRPRLEGPVFGVLNVLQTIPSIALFGLLIVPLSALVTAAPGLAALGISGIGMTPAIIALVLYALLPVVRNTVAGLAGVDRGAIEAARGMGLNRRQMFWQVEFPLALPMLLAGLRIVIVQAIGLAVVAALIGAGGLGAFVFEGLGQYAVDLVLLGALPAIFLALTADFVLQVLTSLLPRRAVR